VEYTRQALQFMANMQRKIVVRDQQQANDGDRFRQCQDGNVMDIAALRSLAHSQHSRPTA
jgi:hypothetical protein